MTTPTPAPPTRRRARALAAFALVAVLGVLAGCEPDPFASLAHAALNADRQAAGRPPLSRDAGLDLRAQAHSVRMRDSWVAAGCGPTKGHLRHSTDLVAQHQPDAVVGHWSKVGENVGVVALGQGGVPAAVSSLQRAYMDSPAHRANIVGEYRFGGNGSVTGPTAAQKAAGACPNTAVDSVMWNTQSFVK